MIPDHLIAKALDAWIGDHNCPHPDLIHVYRVLITRSLEAVAPDIWDQGFEEGRDHGYDFRMAENWDDEYPPEPASPYRHEESA